MSIRRWTMVGDEVLHSRETTTSAGVGGRPLVLVHGVGTTSRYFRPLLRELDGRAEAAAVELPGIGASSSRRLPADIAGQADVLAGWLHATRRTPATVVGNSMGAQTVAELAVRHPGVVTRLVLIGPTMDRAARSVVRQLGRLLVDATVERPSLVAIALTDTLLTRRRAVLRNVRASRQHRLEDRLPLVAAPVLVLRGERDVLVPRRWARTVAGAAPDGRLLEIPGGAHACHHGRPELVARLLLDELAAAERTPTAGATAVR